MLGCDAVSSGVRCLCFEGPSGAAVPVTQHHVVQRNGILRPTPTKIIPAVMCGFVLSFFSGYSLSLL